MFETPAIGKNECVCQFHCSSKMHAITLATITPSAFWDNQVHQVIEMDHKLIAKESLIEYKHEGWDTYNMWIKDK